MVKAISQSLKRPKNNLLAFARDMGPGFLVAVGFIDPGNIAAGVVAGAEYGYSLLWVVTAGTVLVTFLQGRAARVGLGGRECLSEAIGRRVGRLGAYPLAGMLAVAGTATLVAELLGAAIGLNLLTGLPIPLGAAITAVVAYAVVWRGEYHHIEDIVVGFVALIGGCYLLELLLARPDWAAVAKGAAVPSIEAGSIWTVLGLLGAIVMPTNLYLHSSLVQERNWSADDLKKERVDTLAGMAVGGLINAAIIIMSAAVFFRYGREVSALGQAAETLTPLLGEAAHALFAVGLAAAGFASAITGMMASAYGVGGFIAGSQHHHDKPFRLIAAGVTAAALLVLLVDADALWLMVASQAVLCLLLPFTVIPLLVISRKSKVQSPRSKVEKLKPKVQILNPVEGH